MVDQRKRLAVLAMQEGLEMKTEGKGEVIARGDHCFLGEDRLVGQEVTGWEPAQLGLRQT